MIKIENVQTLEGLIPELQIKSSHEHSLDAEERLLALPALIDPHVHLRTPGAEYKENWITGAQAAIAGGITTVFDMPNTTPATVSREHLRLKELLVRKQLAEVGIPLRHHFYLGADREHLGEIAKAKDTAIGLKIYMGSTTGGLLMDDDASLQRAFELAAENNVLVGVHAECERTLNKRKQMFGEVTDPSTHSKIRHSATAERATARAIELAKRTGARLIILHLSTKAELEQVRQAKKEGLPIYAEVTPHHLFLEEQNYDRWGTLIQVNPPIRSKEDQEALWEGIRDETVDTIGSDHAPHTLEEKAKPYGEAPSGVPGLETTLPLLLNAYKQGRITLEQIVKLTRTNIEKIYGLPSNNDVVLVDLELEKEVRVKELKTKCRWSPFAGCILQGWPIYTICQGEIFEVSANRVTPYAATATT